MEQVIETLQHCPTQEKNWQPQEMLRACTLYSMNDMLYNDGVITIEKRQQVAHEIWKKYHV